MAIMHGRRGHALDNRVGSNEQKRPARLDVHNSNRSVCSSTPRRFLIDRPRERAFELDSSRRAIAGIVNTRVFGALMCTTL